MGKISKIMKIILSGIGIEEGTKEIDVIGSIIFNGRIMFDTYYTLIKENGSLDLSKMLCRIDDNGYFYDKEGKSWFNMKIER